MPSNLTKYYIVSSRKIISKKRTRHEGHGVNSGLKTGRSSHHTTINSPHNNLLTAAWMLRQSVIKGLSQAARQNSRALRDLNVSTRAFASSTHSSASAPSPNDSFASGNNAYYADEMYKRWREDPKSVHASWDVYFSGLDKGLPSSQAFNPIPTAVDGAPSLHAGSGQDLSDHLKVLLALPSNTQ